ncbi:hypothetical protein Bca4012_021758 [Brassica carinata]
MDASTGLRDAISWLPDEVLGKILSLLPTKQAASTSVLAKKWRHVFRLVHTLDFDDSDLLQPEEGKEGWPVIRESFRNFVERTLALQCGSPIDKFSLKFHIREMKEMVHVFSWICNVLERGVFEMSLSLKRKNKNLLLPSDLFMSNTLVKLTLGTQIYLDKFPPNTNVSLPALKSLFIDSVVFVGDDLCGVLLRGCPLLEELYVRHRKCEGALFYIYNPTIRKLSVNCEFEFARDGMSFDTPSLVSLNYSDYALEAYTDMNLASLVEARLDIRYSKWIQNPDLTGLIIGISNVQTLHLSPATADVIARCEDGLVLPVFKNLVKLSFGSFNERGWKLLPYLLKQSPKVETLIIQGLDCGYTGDVTIGLFQVKELHVVGYKGTAKELQHLKSLLAGTECIPKVRVEFQEDVVVDHATIIQTRMDLFTLVGVVSIDVVYYD